jgi:hypothetical protein
MRVVKLLAIILLAMVLGYVVSLAIGIVAFEIFDVSQREGASAMGLAFFISPLVAVISGVVGGIGYWIASGRKSAMPEGTVEESRSGNWRPVLTIGAAAAGGYLSGLFLQWMLAGRSYDTYLAALAVSQAPLMAAAVFGGIAWAGVRRKTA